VSVTYITSDVYDNGVAATSKTWTAMSIGTADANRTVIVGITKANGTGHVITGVTIDGVTATQLATVASATTVSADFWAAAVPTHTTADIVVTSSHVRMGISVFSAIAPVATPDRNVVSAGTTPWSTTIDVDANGYVIGVVYGNQGGASTNPRHGAGLATVPAGGLARSVGVSVGTDDLTWTGLTEQYDTPHGGAASPTASDWAVVIALHDFIPRRTLMGTGL
jgi:hypothetical protein